MEKLQDEFFSLNEEQKSNLLTMLFAYATGLKLCNQHVDNETINVFMGMLKVLNKD